MEDFIGTDKFKEVEEQYAPMISALIRKVNIYRDYELYRQVGKVALWQAWMRFDGEKGDFTPYAFRTVHGALLDELAREGKYAKLFVLSEGGHFDELEAPLREEKLPEWIESIDLKEKERKLLKELFVEDKAVKQLAELYGISVAGMKKKRARLLEKIKDSDSFRNRD
ncbi:sigma-70 family RNA polymerase sigma factor [Planococcus halotolerans]|uniref:sigma-70 family RNA polymerase sigma factor n=1 Tax=Planococcus halotolerans TaxID=2233542 RepID=UPI001091AEEE|nr:sigma-70 family RNA polymerase sigma factor [Planococcus halotolerans]QHJ70661.1 sigma-70 family RNA polymerase sigma factor [Planococcus halotolerans]